MIAFIIIIFGIVFMSVLVKNSYLSYENKQYRLKELSEEIYKEYKSVSTQKLKQEIKELHKEYYDLLDKAEVRYEKDNNKEEYGDNEYELPDGTIISNPAESQKYMTYNDYETNLYLRFNIINRIINKRKKE